MKVIQLIDSLRSGGAEKMAVSYANALASRIDASYLCCTRKEGLLKKKLHPEVQYLFLNKKSTFDLSAILRFRRFVVRNEINIIQAHSSSWFLALMVKLTISNVTVVWHDHYGKELAKRKSGFLLPASLFFDGIISVNKDLKSWAKEKLYAERVRFYPNFLLNDSIRDAGENQFPILDGRNDFKIICLANFRPQKDHINLLEAFQMLIQKDYHVSLHLVGKVGHSSYCQKVRKFIHDKNLQSRIFVHGEQENVKDLLIQCHLGVLSSASEGLPLALLEYGQAGLPVVSTRVGQCAQVIGSNGKLVPPRNPGELAEAIIYYIKDVERRKTDSRAFKNSVVENYSQEKVVSQVLQYFRKVKR